jgi:hypothetical protein
VSALNPYTFDVVDRDLRRHLKQIDEDEMNDGELEIKIYGTDTGYGRIILRTIEGAVYMGADVKDAVKLIEEFIKERMGEK